MYEVILTMLGMGMPTLVVILTFIRRLAFFVAAIKQAIDLFDELKEDNRDILERVKNDPKKKELALLFTGAVKKIKGLPNIEKSNSTCSIVKIDYTAG